MPHPGYVSKVVEFTLYGPRWGIVSLTGRKKRRKARRRARNFGRRLRAASAQGVGAFIAFSQSVLRVTPEERLMMAEGSGR